MLAYLHEELEVQLSALLSDIGINIREAHVFSTIDGYSLDVFVVDGWPVENNQVSVDVLLTDLEDYEDEVHVTNGAKSRKRRNLIIDDEELSIQDTNKVKK
ncbi:serine/threonine-protein kinase STY17-like isoform X1 [Solanum lycopersicum]|uniref:serine/threonine-protein kinase STY17-like isoform X1 n=1 Tax=Solanum lycopersicum TaxID=4081 RepID=UPI000532D62A|nr:serine/threonine-protein kinase STY17-like isoform X1 [Solanum lycopersicum]